MPRVLVILSAAIMLLLGSAHLRLTFFGNKLTPVDANLQLQMQRIAPVISPDTSMWKAWVGFNVSHSLGALLFGLIYGYLAALHPTWLFESWFLLGLGASLLGAYAWLGVVYWFREPLIGISAATVCYVCGAAWGVIQQRL